MRGALRLGLLAGGIVLVLSPVAEGGLGLGVPRAGVEAAAVAALLLAMAGPLLLVPLAWRLGARPLAACAVGLAPFVAWALVQVGVRLAQGHSLLEALYLNGSPVQLLMLQIVVLQSALALLGIALLRRAGRGPAALGALAVVLWLLSDAVLLPRYFVAFTNGYQALFQPDLPRPETLPGPLPAGAVPPAGADERPPNLVVILSDDHRFDFAGHAGHPFVETPSLDRLAAEGTRFENAFVTSSLCSPSRASFLTGVEPHRHGVWNNVTPWSDANRTWFEYLKQRGYDTAFIGKWHMPGNLPDLRGVDEFVTFTVFGGQGRYESCPLVVNGREEPSRKRYIAEELTDRAIAFVEQPRDAPFVLYLAHKNVHAEFTPDPRERGRYEDRPVPVPPGGHARVSLTEAQYVHFELRSLPDVVRRYAEAVTSMDREIGRLLDTLDRLGIADETVVVYTSDNGYLWGEHGKVDKRWAFEESIRVPFLVRGPGATAGATSARLVLNLDLAPTLLELAGVAKPASLQGRSLVPLLADPAAPFRDGFFYRYFFEAPYPVPTHSALRTESHKLVAYPGRPPVLYDLAVDPREQRDIAATSPHAAALVRRLEQAHAALSR